MQLYEQHTWVNEDGSTSIVELRPMVDVFKTTEPFARHDENAESKFFAIATHVLGTDRGPMEDRFRVDIPAVSVADAFELLPAMLPEASKKRIADLQAQSRQSAIVLPNGQAIPKKGKPRTQF